MDREDLKKLIEELEKYSAPATTLLSLYIPPDYPIGKVMQQLREEYGTAANIKTKKTQQDVQTALSRAMEVLKNYNKTPKNGLVVFAGNVSDNPSKDDYRLWILEPPEPVPIRLYRTEKKFVLEPLRDMVEDKDAYGFIIVEKDAATLGLLRGKRLEVVEELSAQVPGKTKAGGQSARRYERLREQAVHEFFKRLAEHARERFLPLIEAGHLRGIILAGPAYAKEDFLKGDYLDYRIRDKIIGTVDTSYQGEYGLKEAAERAEEILRETEYMKERELVEEFIRRVVKGDKLVTYGKRETLYATQIGAVEKALVAEEMEDVIRELEKYAKDYGFEVYRISRDTEEGERFRAFGGIGALLRYPIST